MLEDAIIDMIAPIIERYESKTGLTVKSVKIKRDKDENWHISIVDNDTIDNY